MLRAFIRSPGGVIGLGLILALTAIAVVAPEFLAQNALAMDVVHANQNPSLAHLLGTDRLGRDILVRIIVATRLSLGLGVAATLLSIVIGIPLGAGAAMLSGRFRTVALRTLDTLLAFSAILVALFIGSILGAGYFSAALGVGVALSFNFARVVSTLALSIGGRDYIHAARLVGVRGPRLMIRHVMPNIAETLVLQTTFALSGAIVAMSSLSFLGLGVQPPAFDWGRMLTEGVQSMYVTPAAALGPAAAIALAAIAFAFIGESFARAMNPKLWERDSASEPSALNDAHATARTDGPAPGPAPVIRDDIGANVLDVRNLLVQFPAAGGKTITVVDGISFSIGRGEVVGIVGESGSGKTMTALAVAQLVPSQAMVSGQVKLDRQVLGTMSPADIRRWLGTRLAFVFQDPMSSLSPTLTLGTQLAEVAQVHRGVSRRQALDEAMSRMSEVNLPAPRHQIGRYPHELSGGMRQRAMIAMGLMNEPALLIADEPTTALDVTIQAQIMDLLASLNRNHGMAIMLISHNIGLISQNCHRILVMYAGRIIEEGTTEELTRHPLHPYTRALMAAVPDIEGSREVPLEFIPGTMPDLASLPGGCSFHPRCPLAEDQCRMSAPPLRPRSEGRGVACWVANRDTA